MDYSGEEEGLVAFVEVVEAVELDFAAVLVQRSYQSQLFHLLKADCLYQLDCL